MALKRIIPCLLYDGSGLVKTVKFKNPSYVGDPINAIKIFNDKEVDELIFIDINASKEKRKPDFEKIAQLSGEAFMPFAYGGGVKTLEDFKSLFKSGVEKVIVNSLVQEDPGTLKKAVDYFGGQAIVVCVDFKKQLLGHKSPCSHLNYKIKYDLITYAKYLTEDLGVGEIMLQSMDRDGTWEGYDFETSEKVINGINTPVIVTGGCGSINDLKKILYDKNANAAAVGSMAVYSKKNMGVLINFPERSKIIVDK